MNQLEALIRQLPPELQQEVADFVEFLLQKRARKSAKPLRQDWAGTLKEYRDQYTALDLQKKALEWRGDQGHVSRGHKRVAGAFPGISKGGRSAGALRPDTYRINCASGTQRSPVVSAAVTLAALFVFRYVKGRSMGVRPARPDRWP